MPVNPVRMHSLIAGSRLNESPIPPAAKYAAARAAAAAMTPREVDAMADRNALMMSSAEMRVQVSTIAVYGPQAPTEAELSGAEQRSAPRGAVLRSCPRCGTEARGRTDEARADWFTDHMNGAHGGYQ